MNKAFPFPSSKHFYEVKFVDSHEQLAAEWGEGCASDTLAFCRHDFDSAEECVGQLVFFDKSPKIICHECVHAALSFYSHKVGPSKEVQVMTDEEQADYFEEALAVLTENLFEQVVKLADCC